MGGTLAPGIRGRGALLNEFDVSFCMGTRDRGAKDRRRSSPAIFPGELSPAVAWSAEEVGVAVLDAGSQRVDARFGFDRFACTGVAGFRRGHGTLLSRSLSGKG